MLIDYKSDMLRFKIGGFALSFPTNVKFDTFNDPENYYGIIFPSNGNRYQIVDCKLGTRIIINGKEGECKDMPFNLGTAEFLPDFVRVKKLD